MFRQGDVLIIPVAALPNGAQAVQQRGGPIILARGEATGHAHAIRDGEVREYLWKSQDGREHAFLVDVLEPCTVTHEEHHPIPLPRGVYRIVRQREFVERRESGTTVEGSDAQAWGTRIVED